MDPSEYYKLRLEHTLQHTHQATNLIYLMNGAVIAMLYFIARLPTWPLQQSIFAWALIVLSIVNGVHALLITRQGQWYFVLDEALAVRAHADRIEPSGFPFFGTHALYALLHGFLGLLLLIAAIAFTLSPDLLPGTVSILQQ